MSENITYEFTDPGVGTIDLDLTVSLPATDSTGYGEAYAVTAITGTVDGVAISGEYGPPGAYYTNGTFYNDNALFTSDAGGDGGSVEGIDTAGLAFEVNGVEYNLFSQGDGFQLGDYNGGYTYDTVTLDSTTLCFCPGTMILTGHGEVAVETLKIGDFVVTASGEQKPIRWIGRQAVATRFADPIGTLPIRIKAGALDGHLPSRDLLLSPCHAVLVDGILVHAGALVNGASIVRATGMPETFTYYHIELSDHALIVAEGIPAETFIDNVDRMAFDNWAEHEALFGELAPLVELELPRAKAHRQVPQATRSRLMALALALYGDKAAA